VERKHVQDQAANVPVNLFTEQLESIQTMIQDMNRKIDTMTKKENDVEKRLDGLVRQVNKA
jgi:peptidoglycan hydrolase CwlO-like protein